MQNLSSSSSSSSSASSSSSSSSSSKVSINSENSVLGKLWDLPPQVFSDYDHLNGKVKLTLMDRDLTDKTPGFKKGWSFSS